MLGVRWGVHGGKLGFVLTLVWRARNFANLYVVSAFTTTIGRDVQVVKDQVDMKSYFCSSLRLFPLSNIDPSLALAFYCDSLGEISSPLLWAA